TGRETRVLDELDPARAPLGREPGRHPEAPDAVGPADVLDGAAHVLDPAHVGPVLADALAEERDTLRRREPTAAAVLPRDRLCLPRGGSDALEDHLTRAHAATTPGRSRAGPASGRACASRRRALRRARAAAAGSAPHAVRARTGARS